MALGRNESGEEPDFRLLEVRDDKYETYFPYHHVSHLCQTSPVCSTIGSREIVPIQATIISITCL